LAVLKNLSKFVTFRNMLYFVLRKRKSRTHTHTHRHTDTQTHRHTKTKYTQITSQSIINYTKTITNS
jgi:hypothetical protein